MNKNKSHSTIAMERAVEELAECLTLLIEQNTKGGSTSDIVHMTKQCFDSAVLEVRKEHKRLLKIWIAKARYRANIRREVNM